MCGLKSLYNYQMMVFEDDKVDLKFSFYKAKYFCTNLNGESEWIQDEECLNIKRMVNSFSFIVRAS